MRRLCGAFIFVACAGSIAAAAGAPYLTDAIKNAAYLKALMAVLTVSPNPPAWTRQTLSPSGDYVGTPATFATVGGTRYELYFTCKAHDCSDNKLEVMFAPNGAQAWGAIVIDGGAVSYLGAPNPAQQAALKAALQQ